MKNIFLKIKHVAHGLTEIYFSYLLFIYFRFVSLEVVKDFWLFDIFILLRLNGCICFYLGCIYVEKLLCTFKLEIM
jgi:hypothetical protein